MSEPGSLFDEANDAPSDNVYGQNSAIQPPTDADENPANVTQPEEEQYNPWAERGGIEPDSDKYEEMLRQYDEEDHVQAWIDEHQANLADAREVVRKRREAEEKAKKAQEEEDEQAEVQKAEVQQAEIQQPDVEMEDVEVQDNEGQVINKIVTKKLAQKAARKAPVKAQKRQKKQGTATLLEIKKYQKGFRLLFLKVPFSRLVRELIEVHHPEEGYRVQRSALQRFQEATEAFLIGYFEGAFSPYTLHPAIYQLFWIAC
ncbi:hypothetical protein IQ07DRAFT_639601 [Pyrenochaeta sp. DS3sAY3a]|nr:hypothetical protein IQ07DRAFT_639601 [Pyrenochaeta sp. DS3sAY3a]